MHQAKRARCRNTKSRASQAWQYKNLATAPSPEATLRSEKPYAELHRQGGLVLGPIRVPIFRGLFRGMTATANSIGNNHQQIIPPAQAKANPLPSSLPLPLPPRTRHADASILSGPAFASPPAATRGSSLAAAEAAVEEATGLPLEPGPP